MKTSALAFILTLPGVTFDVSSSRAVSGWSVRLPPPPGVERDSSLFKFSSTVYTDQNLFMFSPFIYITLQTIIL